MKVLRNVYAAVGSVALRIAGSFLMHLCKGVGEDDWTEGEDFR